MFCDASNVAVGSALCQPTGEKRKDLLVAYASKQLTPAERNYSTTERECLATVFSVKKFRHYLICNPVVFFVDHMAIKYLVNKPELSGRLARWVLLLEEFNYTVEYKHGRMHLQADHLSRLSENMGTHPIDDSLIDDKLFVVTATPDWYVRIVEFLTTQRLPVEWTKEERMKVRVNSRHFAVIGNRLFRRIRFKQLTYPLLEPNHPRSNYQSNYPGALIALHLRPYPDGCSGPSMQLWAWTVSIP